MTVSEMLFIILISSIILWGFYILDREEKLNRSVKGIIQKWINRLNWISLVLVYIFRSLIEKSCFKYIIMLFFFAELFLSVGVYLICQSVNYCRKRGLFRGVLILTVLLLAFDAIGVFTIIFDTPPAIQSESIVFEKLVYAEHQKSNRNTIYCQILDRNNENIYEVPWDIKDFFEEEKFCSDIKEGDSLELSWIPQKQYREVIRIRKQNIEYISKSEDYILNMNSIKWKSGICFTKHIVLLSWGGLFLVKIFQVTVRKLKK